SAGPDCDIGAAIREHFGEGSAPTAGAENRNAARTGCQGANRHRVRHDPSSNLPISDWPLRAGSQRSAGGVSPRISATKLLIATMRRSVASVSIIELSGRPRYAERSTGG